MKIAVGIITNNRPIVLKRLVHAILPQLHQFDKIIIVENGSFRSSGITILAPSKIRYTHSQIASIPKARNSIFTLCKNDFDLIVYIDDDCIPSDNWLNAYRIHYKKFQYIHVFIGKSNSIPKSNIYAQTTQLLQDIWFTANTNGQYTKILDSKNFGLRLSRFRKNHMLFNEDIAYATDIELGVRLVQKNIPLLYCPDVIVYHEERTTTSSFIQHRFRLSLSYRKITEHYPQYFTSNSLLRKYTFIWNNLHKSILSKIYIIVLLSCIYGIVLFTQLTENTKYSLIKNPR